MSTDIETNLKRHNLVTFWGGDHRGACIQITCTDPIGPPSHDEEGFVQLTMEDASELIGHLAAFVKQEAVRRQCILREQIEELKLGDKNVFHEIANLAPTLFDVPASAVKFVSKFCPIVKPTNP